jgi:hypothetical protein
MCRDQAVTIFRIEKSLNFFPFASQKPFRFFVSCLCKSRFPVTFFKEKLSLGLHLSIIDLKKDCPSFALCRLGMQK